jgi:hypothetical protein
MSDTVSDVEEAQFLQAVGEFAYSVPHEKYIYRNNGKWQDGTPVTERGIRQFLLARHYPPDVVDMVIGKGLYHRALSLEILPNEPPVVRDANGQTVINLWSPPRYTPADVAGPMPRIETLLRWLTFCPTNNPTDEQLEGFRWVLHWLARKVQSPALLSMVAPIFGTEPGAGKGTLYNIIAMMLGEDNCEIVDRSQLESKYTPWARALFVFGDEIKSHENQKDVEERLKLLIASPKMMVEVKNVNAVTIPNRKAWMFASNDRISPIRIEPNDRRYSYFKNHTPVTKEYRALLRSCYLPDGTGFTPAFIEEVRGFWRMLLDLEVELPFASDPFRNESRQALVSSSHAAHDVFTQRLEEDGIDALIDELLDSPKGLKFRGDSNRKEWDFGQHGIAKAVVYEAYRVHCEAEGRHAMSANRFGPVLRAVEGVVEGRQWAPSGKNVRVWIMPRHAARRDVENGHNSSWSDVA